jgi:hypothetical protein
VLKKYQPALILTFTPSVRLKHLLIIVHIIALAACLLAYIPVMFKIGLVVCVAVHFRWSDKCLKQQHWQIRHTDENGWEALIDGQFIAINILSSTVITTVVIVLHFEYQNTIKCHLAILNDALNADNYRQFIVRLKTTDIK